jgi:glycosyltransferase involved in cell wall biosynthesis
VNVLHVTPSFYPAFTYGGPTISVYQLCLALAHEGCAVRVLTTDSNGIGRVLTVETNKAVEMSPGLTVRYCRKYVRNSVSPKLVALLPEHVRWADIIHLTGVYNFPTFPTLWTCRSEQKSLVWSPRGALQRWPSTRRVRLKAAWEGLCRFIAPPGTVLHVTSEREAVESARCFPGFPAKVISNGVELPDSLVRRNEEGKLRLLFLGRIDRIKGIENLLSACAILNRDWRRNWSLAVAGNGDRRYTEELKIKVTQSGLTEQVNFLGNVSSDAKRHLFGSSDLAVFPSHSENFGMAVAEALAHAVPVIASRGTPWEAVEREGCGLWINNDAATLAGAIQRMSTMPLTEMGCRGREWMRREFGWQQVANKMVKTYERLVAAQRH